jgi:tRNA nucleotidyltransferase (CCA-adding enzyme)
VRMIAVLRDCGALARLMPELAQLPADAAPAWQALQVAAQRGLDLAIRFAVMLHQIPSYANLTAYCQRFKVPAEHRDLAILLQREWQTIIQAQAPESMVALFQRCDAWRKPARFEQLLQAVNCITDAADAKLANERLRTALHAAQQVQGGEIAQQIASQFPAQPHMIAQAIYAARVLAAQASL